MKTAEKPFAFVYESMQDLPTRAVDKALHEWQKMKRSGNRETIVAFCRKRCEDTAKRRRTQHQNMSPAVFVVTAGDKKDKERTIYQDAHFYDFYETMNNRLVEGYGTLAEADRYETEETRELRRAELFAPKHNITLMEVGR